MQTYLSRINTKLIFLFPIFFALPDFNIALSVVNLRIDDILIYILFLINIRAIGSQLSIIKHNVLLAGMAILLFYSLFSLSITTMIDIEKISSYEAIKFLGSIPFIIIIPYLFSFEKNRKFLYYGTFIAVFIWIFQLYENYQMIVQNELIIKATSGEFKELMSLSSINPNSVSVISLIFALVLFLAYVERGRMVYLYVALVMLVIPVIVFSRGVIFGMLIAMIFSLFVRKLNFKNLVVILISVALIVAVMFQLDLRIIESAVNIDLNTGAGTSSRFLLWSEGFELFLKSPIFGHGLSSEEYLFGYYFNGHMAHNVYLHHAIELGVVGLTIFIVSFAVHFLNLLNKHNKTNQPWYLIQILFIVIFLVADIFDQLLYMNKYAFIIYALVSIRRQESV
jgi:O-antigen ligase